MNEVGNGIWKHLTQFIFSFFSTAVGVLVYCVFRVSLVNSLCCVLSG